jgi:prolipoprotein diacylglyceryltransferase
MTSDVWSWTTSWILVSFIGLASLALVGPVVGGWASKQLERALEENGPGDLGEAARRMTRHPALWLTEFGNLGVVFGIIWNMTQKPGTVEAIAAVAVGYLVGVGLALRFSRAPVTELPAVAEAAR